ncbi:MAG: glycosyltransferase family 39 protein [Thermoleophilaceae bacterium]|nr:glycosyltransferase family 39 protein [Thermoleophilaceae bacterium]
MGWIAATRSYAPTFDAADYDGLARLIAAGSAYPLQLSAAGYVPTALRPPGYPYSLGAFYSVVGDRLTAGRLLGAGLGVIAVLLVYAIARRLGGDRIGLIAGWVAALFPPFVVLNGGLVSETLFITLELAAIWAMLRWRQDGGRLVWAGVAGAFAAAAALTRPNGLALIAVLLLVVAASVGTPVRTRLASLAVIAGAAVLVLLPWGLRNLDAFEQVVPVSTNAGFTAGGIYNSSAMTGGDLRGIWRAPFTVPDFRDLYEDPGLDQAELDSAVLARAISIAWDHPRYTLDVVRLNGGRLTGLFGPQQIVDQWNSEIGARSPAPVLMKLSVVALLLLALLAALRPRRLPEAMRREWWLWILFGLLLVTTLPLLANPRYRTPLDPFLIILAAVPLGEAGRRLAGPLARPPSQGAGAS